MNSSPAIDIPTDLVQRWTALQQTRARRAAGRCDCQCRRCRSGSAALAVRGPAAT